MRLLQRAGGQALRSGLGGLLGAEVLSGHIVEIADMLLDHRVDAGHAGFQGVELGFIGRGGLALPAQGADLAEHGLMKRVDLSRERAEFSGRGLEFFGGDKQSSFHDMLSPFKNHSCMCRFLLAEKSVAAGDGGLDVGGLCGFIGRLDALQRLDVSVHQLREGVPLALVAVERGVERAVRVALPHAGQRTLLALKVSHAALELGVAGL